MIGIVGGIGPYAGLDLKLRILNNTIAFRDQDHLSILLSSLPDLPDRTEFLEGSTLENPADKIAANISMLEKAGCTTVGIACNTAHADKIFSKIQKILAQKNAQVKVLHMVHEVVQILKNKHQSIQKVGVLCTNGSYKFNVYFPPLLDAGFEISMIGSRLNNEWVHQAVYSAKFGIKSQSGRITEETISGLNKAIEWYANEGVQALVLGCTEIPLAAPFLNFRGIIPINSNEVLARALIRESCPEKLKQNV